MPSARAAARAVRHGASAAAPFLAAGCGRLDALSSVPPVTPEQWCRQRPCVELGGVVLDEPLATALVFLLAGLWIGAGAYFWRTRRGQRSRGWFGLALALGGVGAAQAGIVYQAFGFALKCAGREICRAVHGLEVGYSAAQALSVGAMLAAVAYACAAGRLRRGLLGYALLNAALYVAVASAGVMLPSRRLLSFEVLMGFALPGILAVIVIAGRRRARSRGELERALVVAALLLLAVQAAYFGYAAAGLGPLLWADGAGFYFSANDVLHVGMIGWLAYVVRALGAPLRDAGSTDGPG